MSDRYKEAHDKLTRALADGCEDKYVLSRLTKECREAREAENYTPPIKKWVPYDDDIAEKEARAKELEERLIKGKKIF
jgi:hypothetical protein